MSRRDFDSPSLARRDVLREFGRGLNSGRKVKPPSWFDLDALLAYPGQDPVVLETLADVMLGEMEHTVACWAATKRRM